MAAKLHPPPPSSVFVITTLMEGLGWCLSLIGSSTVERLAALDAAIMQTGYYGYVFLGFKQKTSTSGWERVKFETFIAELTLTGCFDLDVAWNGTRLSQTVITDVTKIKVDGYENFSMAKGCASEAWAM